MLKDFQTKPLRQFQLRPPQAIMARFGEEMGRDMIDMVMRSADDVDALIDKYGIACDAERTGWIQGARNAASGQVLRRRCLAWRNAGSVNPLKYARGLASAAVDRGASLFVGSPVISLEPAGSAWRVATPEGELHAAAAIASNAARAARSA